MQWPQSYPPRSLAHPNPAASSSSFPSSLQTPKCVAYEFNYQLLANEKCSIFTQLDTANWVGKSCKGNNDVCALRQGCYEGEYRPMVFDTPTQKCGQPIDIMFMLDESASVLIANWRKMTKFVDTLIRSFDVGKGPVPTRCCAGVLPHPRCPPDFWQRPCARALGVCAARGAPRWHVLALRRDAQAAALTAGLCKQDGCNRAAARH